MDKSPFLHATPPSLRRDESAIFLLLLLEKRPAGPPGSGELSL